jgi:hypothetical protein
MEATASGWEGVSKGLDYIRIFQISGLDIDLIFRD